MSTILLAGNISLHPIDWIIIVVYLVGCVAIGVWMRRYINNVEDFAVAGREMDLNLGIASLAATEVGIVTVMYGAQLGFENGFAGATPGVMGCLAMLLIGLTGFVIVPMRNAGVMTIPELFEKRFGKLVRWLAGVVVVVGGLLNMGIFLRVGGEFLLYCVGLDPNQVIESVTIPVLNAHPRLLETMMIGLLAVILLYTALGGMVSVLVTDYLQFLVMGLGIVITSVLVIHYWGWTNIVTKLDEAHQQKVTMVDTKTKLTKDELVTEAKSIKEKNLQVVARDDAKEGKLITIAHPFNPVKTLGWGWFVWQGLLQIAIMTTWQTTIARVLAARDAKTAKKIYVRTSFYFVGRFALPALWGAATFLFFWQKGLDGTPGLPPNVSSLDALPIFLGQVMPVGLMGILLAAMLAAEMSTDSGYLLTWATVIYNDIIGPCLRNPLSPRVKLFVVRMMVLLIGVFLVFYGLVYKLQGKTWDYLAVTGNIYMASLFTLLVAGLYWKKAHRWGAVAAIILGAIGPLAFVFVNQVYKDLISAEAAGLFAFALAFAGMLVGSMIGNAVEGDGIAAARESQP